MGSILEQGLDQSVLNKLWLEALYRENKGDKIELLGEKLSFLTPAAF